MFRGLSALNLDAKGRLAMPTRYRELLHAHNNGQLVITIDTEETCLLLYPLHEWEIIEHKIEALPSLEPRSRRLQRLLIGHATDVELDSNGRILLPSLLREYMLLDRNNKAIVLVGQGKKFEVWDAQHWQGRRETWLHPDDTQTIGLSDSLQQLSL